MSQKLATQDIAKFMELICHPARLEIISELKDCEFDVSTLQLKTGLSQSRVSQHLSALRRAGILKERREGRKVFYGLAWIGLTKWMNEAMDIMNKNQFN
jgi:DNA-binding transcriptional ArsR family regulator